MQLLAEVADQENYTNTLYLFSREDQTLLSVTLPKEKTPCDWRTPSPQDTLRRVLKAAGLVVTRVTIYLYLDSVYYTYISVANGNHVFEINCEASEALSLAQLEHAPICAEKEVLKEQGIAVTRELLEQALSE